MHRNTYLLVSVLAVLAALVVGVNVGKKAYRLPAVTPTPTPIAIVATPTAAFQTYTSLMCGFSLMYPNIFSVMENASGSAVLTNTSDSSQSIIVTCQKNIPVPALAPKNVEALSILNTSGASVSAKLYHDSAGRDGAPIDALIFRHPGRGMDIFIAGYGDAFNAILKTVTITQ